MPAVTWHVSKCSEGFCCASSWSLWRSMEEVSVNHSWNGQCHLKTISDQRPTYAALDNDLAQCGAIGILHSVPLLQEFASKSGNKSFAIPISSISINTIVYRVLYSIIIWHLGHSWTMLPQIWQNLPACRPNSVYHHLPHLPTLPVIFSTAPSQAKRCKKDCLSIVSPISKWIFSDILYFYGN